MAADSGSPSESSVTSDIARGLAQDAAAPRLQSFQGTVRQWTHYTRRERALATSLESLEAADLAVHLYNVHAWKRRLIQSANASVVQDIFVDTPCSTFSAAGDATTSPRHPNGDATRPLQSGTWQPSPFWTAWPLEDWAVNRTTRDVVQELHECVLSEMSRQARAAYAQRPFADDMPSSEATTERDGCSVDAPVRASMVVDTGSGNGPSHITEHAEDFSSQGRSRSKGRAASVSGQSQASASATRSNRRSASAVSAFISDNETMDFEEEALYIGELGASTPEHPEIYEPVPLTDEDRIEQCLGLQARHVLARVDDILLSLHNARAAYDNKHGSDAEDDTNSEESGSSETASENGLTGSPTDDKPKRVLRPPRDWSEIVGMAALRGWDSAIIDRTVARCEALLGETMNFVPSNTRRPTTRTVGRAEDDELTSTLCLTSGDEQFDDAPIAYPNGLGQTWHCLVLQCGQSSSTDTGGRQLERHMMMQHNIDPTKGAAWNQFHYEVHPDELSCPDPWCKMSLKRFSDRWRLNEHVKRRHGHKLSRLKRGVSHDVSSLQHDQGRKTSRSERDRMLGGVHLDGFLQPIQCRKGWVMKSLTKGRNDTNESGENKRRRLSSVSTSNGKKYGTI